MGTKHQRSQIYDTLTKLKVDIDSPAILVEVFNILLSIMDRTTEVQ